MTVTHVSADADEWFSTFLNHPCELHGVAVHLRTTTRDGWVATAYLPGAVHDGTEGELYSLEDDPLQRVNRWDDPAVRSLRDDLLDDLWASLPPARQPRLPVDAPV